MIIDRKRSEDQLEIARMTERSSRKFLINITMRNVSKKQLLEYESKKDKNIQYILANIDSITHEEIEKYNFSFPWIRLALNEVKSENDAKKYEEQISAITKPKEEIYGDVIQWNYLTQYIKSANRKNTLFSTFIEVKENRYLFLPTTGGYWYESSFSEYRDEILNKIHSIGKFTLNEYKKLVKDQLNKEYGNISSQIIDATNQTSSGFSFSIKRF